MERKKQLRQVIVNAIVDAFSGVPYPGDEAITLDATSFPGASIYLDLKGRHWRDVAPEVLDRQPMVFLLPEARRFYLPAFLLRALDLLPERYHPSDLLALVPPDDDGRFTREHETYTSAQRDAIRMFLEVARDEATDKLVRTLASLALDRTWGKQGGIAPGGNEPEAEGRKTRVEQVKQAIRQAFSTVPYPGDEQLAAHPKGQDGPELIRDFKGYHWREVPRAILAYNYSSLPHFSQEGLRFFLPAYIFAGLDCHDIILDFTVYELDASHDDPALEQWQRDRYAVFHSAERDAIRLFLEYVRDEVHDADLEQRARRALEKDWRPR